ncbi:MAG: cell division protein FtsL [Pseudomonadota bacterium]|uniref:Cell division protein FtsL n=1 Tax=Candidatus Desulfatibia profunda TaxID=2841695 RepID=A0A8J6NLT4_9BACT|nr:cell division protein FtsL [Candidatus Desulfatibia profunda]MBL7178706.1 cell division protein FtsL [Desulfobacterales bacterium]
MNQKNQKKSRRLKELGFWIILLLFFISELFLYTWCRVQCVAIGYEISKIAYRQKEITALRNNLKIELASLKSPARIAEIAKSRLGLTMPTPEQLILIP